MMKVKQITGTAMSNVAYGLILPNGALYDALEYGGHASLAYKLVDAGVLDKQSGYVSYDNCVHISDGDFDYARVNTSYQTVTQAQLDTMFDYALANNLEFPFDQMEVR